VTRVAKDLGSETLSGRLEAVGQEKTSPAGGESQSPARGLKLPRKLEEGKPARS